MLRSAAQLLLGSWVWFPPGAWVCLLCVFVLSGRGLCNRPIPRPEESYRLSCVVKCDQVKLKRLDTYCEQVGRRGKDYERERKPSLLNKWVLRNAFAYVKIPNALVQSLNRYMLLNKFLPCHSCSVINNSTKTQLFTLNTNLLILKLIIN
jgi:hypothetical protein